MHRGSSPLVVLCALTCAHAARGDAPAGGAANGANAANAADAANAAPETVVVVAHKPAAAASALVVRARELDERPIGSPQDLVAVTPGLVAVQHSGGGKASQYFLRGFDADHGTDLALSIDGVPINMPSHAHGQGFADTNFSSRSWSIAWRSRRGRTSPIKGTSPPPAR